MYPHRINLAGPWEVVTARKTFRVNFADDLVNHPQLGDRDITLRRVFRWPTELLPSERLWLTVNSTSYPLEIRLNGELLGEHQALYLPWTRDISNAVQERNLLEVFFRLADTAAHIAWCGPIYLQVRRQVHLTDIFCQMQWQNHQPRLEISARAKGTSDKPLAVVVRLNDQEVYYQECPELTRTGDRLQLSTPPIQTTLWEAGQPNVLQTLDLHLLDPACLLEQNTYRIGFREVQRLGDNKYHINEHDYENVVIHDLDEPIDEPTKIERLDREGTPIILRIPAEETLYAPFFWHHPCIIDYSFANSSIASRSP
jgi:beta-galactosidase/beta-glucuronidase